MKEASEESGKQSIYDRIARLIAAARVPDSVRADQRGLWEIKKFKWPDDFSGNPFSNAMLKISMRAAGIADFTGYTALLRTTLATLDRPLGEVVMEDSPRELRKHLPILLEGKGRILITGLGLGCVVRGLLSKPDVTHIDIIEIDPVIIGFMAGEFSTNPRVSIYQGDALTIPWRWGTSWDYAWHDIWTDEKNGEPALQLAHAELIARYDQYCPVQGAWEFPRWSKRKYGAIRPLLGTKRITQREYQALMFSMPRRPEPEEQRPIARVKFVRDFSDARYGKVADV